MEEPDPVRRLKMFSVKLDIKGRVTILKSLNFARGTILGQVEAQGRDAHRKSLGNIQGFLTESINKRLEHFLNRQISDKLFGVPDQNPETA